MKLTHWGPAGLTTLRGPRTREECQRYSWEKARQIEAAIEAQWLEELYVPTVDCYLEGTEPEVIVRTGKVRYEVEVNQNDLYFLTFSLQDARKKNIFHNTLLALGYKGYFVPEYKQARLFGEITLRKE